MKKLIIAILLLLLIPVTNHALDKKIVSSNEFKIGIFDTVGNGIAGLDVNATGGYSDFAIKIVCGAGNVITVDETGDTMADEGAGYYLLITNDVFTAVNEAECLIWVVGEGDYIQSGVMLIAKTPAKFKAVGATMDGIGLYKQITVTSTPLTSTIISTGFSEASNKGYIGATVNCPNATSADNRPIFLKIISFNPATDTVTLNGAFSTALTISDVCNIYIDTVR